MTNNNDWFDQPQALDDRMKRPHFMLPDEGVHDRESAANATSLPPFLNLMWQDRERRRVDQLLTAIFTVGLIGLAMLAVSAC